MALGPRARQHWPAAIVVAFAFAIAWAFAATVLAHARELGFPLDDSYIYLTYAKQFGRAHPFTYFSGGGYSAGSTSALWPMVLAPFWTLGARGHALVWVAFLLSAALFAATGLGVYAAVRRVAGSPLVGAASAIAALSVGAFAFGALSGMEVALASALLTWLFVLLAPQRAADPPGWRLATVMAAASLSRPEAMLAVGGIAALGAIATWRARGARTAVRWLVPLAAPLAWLSANRIFAGHWMPNTGVVKSHFYLPGFDWTYWHRTVVQQTGVMLETLFWRGGPFAWPRVLALAIVVGAVRAIRWARREQAWLAAGFAIGAPLLLMFGVEATSGANKAFQFQNYRYVASAFPMLFVLAGCALAPPARLAPPERLATPRWRRAWIGAACALAVAFAYTGWPELRANLVLYAQGAADENAQVVRIGRYLRDKLPGARVMLHDAGAIAYYGDGPVFDMLGLVTNRQAGVANNGPGSRFEFLERMPAAARPQYVAYYPGWMGTLDFFGDAVLHTPLGPGFTQKQRLVGGGDMQLMPAVWDHAGTGEAPLSEHAGWAVADDVDIADLDSEAAHAYTATLGRRRIGDPTERWSFVSRQTAPSFVIDGGRTIRVADNGVASEAFDLALDPAKPARLVIRTGGVVSAIAQERVGAVSLEILDGDRVLGSVAVPAPSGSFVELALDLPPGVHRIRTRARAPYRVFHYFALQPQ